MTNLFKVEGQTLTPLAIYEAVSDTVNYLTFAFSFDSEWDGLTKSAVFTKGDDEYEVVLTSDAITADDHVNLSAGVWEISVVGDLVVDAVVTRQITSTSYNFTVTQSGAISGSVFPPSVASQVYINTNQATPQTFVGGIPKLTADRVIDLDNELADKKYVDDKVATVTADDFNHNDLANKQGGTTNEFYHVTAAEKAVISNTSGTNTGDQALPTRNSLGLDTDDTVTFANLSGTNTGDQNAAGVAITDAGGFYDATTVDGALQEVGADIATINSETLEKVSYGVYSGLKVNAQATPAMTVIVPAGVIYMSNGARLTPALNSALAITAAGATMRRDIVYVNSSGVSSYLAGSQLASRGARTFTVTTNAVAGDTLTVGGVTLTASAAAQDSKNFIVGVDINATVTNIKASLNANSSLNTVFAATGSGAAFTLTEIVTHEGSTPAAATYTGAIVVASGSATTGIVALEPAVPTGGQLLAGIFVAAGASSITSSAITDKRKLILDSIVGNNLINEINTLSGGFINNNTGALAYDRVYRYCPDYIEIDPALPYTITLFDSATKLKSTGGTILGAYYTASKVYISGISQSYSAQVALTIPTTAKYVRLSLDDNYTYKAWMLTQDPPSAAAYYVPYRYGIKPEIYPLITGYEKLKDKKIVLFGDSQIGQSTTGYSGVSEIIRQITGAAVTNAGFGGTNLSQHSEAKYDAFSMYRLAYAIANSDWSVQDAAMASYSATLPTYYAAHLAALKQINFNNVDYITIGHGLNDFDSNVVLDNVSDDDDITTLSGALRYSLNLIIAAYPRLKILLCTPTYRYWQTAGTYVDDVRTHTNTIPALMKDYADAIIAIGNGTAGYGLPYLDCLRTEGINYYNRTTYLNADGVHHVSAGSRRHAEKIAASIISMY